MVKKAIKGVLQQTGAQDANPFCVREEQTPYTVEGDDPSDKLVEQIPELVKNQSEY